MSLKPDGGTWTVKEQIIEDASGLTFQFEVDPTGEPRLRVYGDCIPFGNREIQFSPDGKQAGAGSSTSGLCRPAWLGNID